MAKLNKAFVLSAPKWTKHKNYEFPRTPVDLTYDKSNELFSKIGTLNPLHLFELFIDDDVIEFIVKSTNKYAAIDCDDSSYCTYYGEIRKFIGIMYVTGYHTLRTIQSY